MGFLNDIIQKAQTFAESDKGKELIEKGESYLNNKTGAQPPTGAGQIPASSQAYIGGALPPEGMEYQMGKTPGEIQAYKDGYNAALTDAITALRWWAEQQNYTDIADQNDWARVINDLKQ